MSKSDVVIIGGGLAGLAAALNLTNQGKKVVVLEKHHMPGGYATNFKRKDSEGNTYVFDVALHGIGGFRENNSFYILLNEKLGILKNIKALEKSETATIMSKDGKESDIPSNFDDYKYYLINKYKNNTQDIEKLFDFLMDLNKDMIQVIKEDKIPKYNDYLKSITLYEFLRKYTDNEELIEEFSFLWLYHGLPSKKLNALYYLLPWISYHIGGTYYIEGGSGKFSTTIMEMIEAGGSKVNLSSEVIGINTYNDNIISVITKNGVEYKADNFIIACDPTNILDMIKDENELIIEYKNKMRSCENGISLSKLFIGIDCRSEDIGIKKGDYFVEVLNSEKTYEAIISGDYENMDFGVTGYDILDKNMNGEKQGVVTVTIGDIIDNWPEYKSEEYKAKKKEVTHILMDKLEKVFPNIKGHIKVVDLGTPYTMKRYTNNSDGSVYGWSQKVGQGGIDRLGFKTPLKNTFLAGAWSNPGGGFQGVITSGYHCSNRLLRNIEDKECKENIDEDIIMSKKMFMEGMAANVNSHKAKELDIVFKFIFDNSDIFFLRVHKGKGKVLKNTDLDIDLSIKTEFKTWYDIVFKGKNGIDAYEDGEITVEGSTDIFMKIPEIFEINDSSNECEKKEFNKLNSTSWMSLALIPWIIYWIANPYLEPILLTLIASIYLCTFILLIKPVGNKEISILEAGTFVLFSAYGYLSNLDISLFDERVQYILDIGLILIFILSIIINKPITLEYSKFEYPKEIVKTKLFLNINKVITTTWVIVFSIIFVLKLIIEGPLENIAYAFIVVGLVISSIYPKRKLGE